MNLGKHVRIERGANINGADEVTGWSFVGAAVTLPKGARLSHDAHVVTNADVLVMGPGPSGAVTTAHRDTKIGIRVNSRCYTGSVQGFRERLDKDITVTPEQRAQALVYIEQIERHFV
jgi:hypothetical protein